MPLSLDQIKQLQRLNDAQRKLLEALAAQLKAEDESNAGNLYPDARILTRKP